MMDITLASLNQTIAVAYLARGADRDWLLSIERYLNSYRRNPSGIEHSLYVIFKGFTSNADLEKARAIFNSVLYKPVFLGDDHFDIGAYIEWANIIEEDKICVFNTASEILAPDWLHKFSVNLAMPNVGLVGATASYESLNEYNSTFPIFPNIHIRSTGFMIDRKFFLSIVNGIELLSKIAAFNFESGPKSLTRQVLSSGKEILLVGRNGRGYSPEFWATSHTFRQGTQNNLLIADNQTRNFTYLPWYGKSEFVIKTWGKYIREGNFFHVDY